MRALAIGPQEVDVGDAAGVEGLEPYRLAEGIERAAELPSLALQATQPRKRAGSIGMVRSERPLEHLFGTCVLRLRGLAVAIGLGDFGQRRTA